MIKPATLNSAADSLNPIASIKNGGFTIRRIPAKLTNIEMMIYFYKDSLRITLANNVVTIGVVKKIAIASLKFIILMA